MNSIPREKIDNLAKDVINLKLHILNQHEQDQKLNLKIQELMQKDGNTYDPDNFEEIKPYIPLAEEQVKAEALKKIDVWKWRVERKTGDWIKEGVDPLKAKKALLDKYNFITTGDKVFTMLYYDNGYYRPGGEKITQEALQKITEGLHLTINLVREVTAHIQRETFTTQEKLSSTPKELVCLKNGILNVKTKELTPHTPEIIFTQQIPVTYVKGADCPGFKKFLSDVLSSEEILTLQEMLGHFLIRDYRYKKAFIMVGAPNSGKTTLLKLIVAFMGKENTSSLSLHHIVKDKFAAIHLKDKLLNFYDDLSSEDINDSGALKIVTGNGYVSGEHKFGERVHFENYAKLVFACNEIFGLKNKDLDDEAYYGRWIIFFFNNTFDGSKQDKGLFDRINTPQERSGILNWALEGLDRLETQGQFSYNKSPDEIKKIMQRGSNTVAAFAQDCLEEAQGQWMSKEALYNAYCLYVKQECIGRVTKEKLGRDLPKFANYIIDSKSEKVTGWRNVKLNQTIQAFSNIISTSINSVNNPIFPHARNDKISMNSMIAQETDPTYFNCSMCDAPPPCKFANSKTGRPLCELCASSTTEEKIGDDL